MAFEAVGAALSIVVGACMEAVPGLQIAGAFMAVGGELALVGVIDEAVTAATGNGILGNIVLAADPGNTNGAKIADMAFGITLAVAGLTCAVCSFGAGLMNAPRRSRTS